MSDPREEILLDLGRSPELAHAVLFKRSHSTESPPFHLDMVRRWHSDAPRVLTMAFRGGGKSTCAEEAITIQACLRRFHNCVILGESEGRAVERLRAIKHQFEENEFIRTLFDIGPGGMWTDSKIILSNGVMIQAYGRGQSLRGVKHLTYRPDLIFLDDIEDEESVKTPEAREKTSVWFYSTVLPALHPKGRIRMAATPLDPQALAPSIKTNSTLWVTDEFPVEYVGAEGRAPMWPGMFPLEAIDLIEQEMTEAGKHDRYMQEYRLQATNPASRTFREEHMRVEPLVRTWHAVYAMYDPARTTHKTSATTGKVVWSWIGNRLVVWDASARRWMPDEIVSDVFAVDEQYSPVAIGVEETGLNEFLLQPLRQQQVLRGVTLPLRALNAPRGKLDFIRGLQPFFRAGEVVFARELPELRRQLLAFPTGEIDAPNALAYALRMRPGSPVYDGFTGDHVVEGARLVRSAPLWLALNSDGRSTAAVLCQVHDGRLTLFADWLREGGPGDTLPDILKEASLEASGTPLRLVAPPEHFTGYDTVGLRATATRIPVTLRKGGAVLAGREELRDTLRRRVHGDQGLRVGAVARWTARAFAGGYARSLDKGGALIDTPDANAYAVLMGGLESFAALLRNVAAEDDNPGQVAYTSDGRRYISARG